jgi:hypothetical protein
MSRSRSAGRAKRNPSGDLPAAASERHAGRASLRPRGDLPADRTHSEEPLNLQRERVSKSYRGHLDKALIDLNHWCALRHRKKPFEVWEDEAAINELLINYVQYLFESSKRSKTGLRHARHAILSVQTECRQLRGRLRGSWDSIVSWQALVPLQLRVPWDPLILVGVFVVALIKGFMLDRRRAHLWIPFGIGCLLMFHGMLRPGEFLRLDRRHVRVPADRPEAGVQHVLCALVDPKNSRAMGRLQTTTIDCKLATVWLEWLLAGLSPDARIFPSSAASMRSLLQTALLELGLGHMGLTPGGLRPGGATYRFRNGEDVSRLRFSGRWRSITTLEHYIQEVAASMIIMDMPKGALQRLQRLARKAKVFMRPPKLPWESFFSRARQLAQLKRWRTPGPRHGDAQEELGWSTDSSGD